MHPNMKEGIRDVLVRQFELHEAGWFMPGTSTGRVEPVAHGVQDIYKCLHQGVFGVGHLIDNPLDFRSRLLNEIRRADSNYCEPLRERVSPDGLVMRINLRPFRALFKEKEEMGCDLLVNWCRDSAARAPGSPAEFFHALECFMAINSAGELEAGGMVFSFPEHVVDDFMREVRNFTSETGFLPVLSHSAAYKSHNDPSYRVVHSKALANSPLAALIDAAEDIGTGYVH
ncbi:MAG: hypothetical protein ACP5SH_10025 [Syntrophobacteraceae bacterium]